MSGSPRPYLAHRPSLLRCNYHVPGMYAATTVCQVYIPVCCWYCCVCGTIVCRYPLDRDAESETLLAVCDDFLLLHNPSSLYVLVGMEFIGHCCEVGVAY